MDIPLPFHLLIHLALAVASGYVVGRRFNKVWLGIGAGIGGGFLVDFDHVLEYFLVFGPHFNLLYFLQGREFLISDKIRLWFHAWEYVPVFVIIALWPKISKEVRVIFFALALSLGVHLLSDSFINRTAPGFYSLSYRAFSGFSAEKLMSPESYLENQELKEELGL